MIDFRKAYISRAATLSDTLENLNRTGFKTALVVDEDEKLIGIVADMDIRKALLRNTPLKTPVFEFMNPNPVVGYPHMSHPALLELLMKKGIDTLPVVDEERRVVNFIRTRDFVPSPPQQESPIVIMAGGYGKRLWPLTLDTPKPLLNVADRPILSHMFDLLKRQGFGQVNLAVHYKTEMFESFLQENTPCGLNVDLLVEDSPLGTAGSLKTLQEQNIKEPIFVINGDILTEVDFSKMKEWHVNHGNALTIGTHHYQVKVQFGVVYTKGQELLGIDEKPVYSYNINAGIYLLEPEVLDYIPGNSHMDMTQLIEILIAHNQRVGAFPISEPWVDIGDMATYQNIKPEAFKHLFTSRT